MIHILIFEGDKELNHAVCKHLNSNSYHAAGCPRPSEAFDRLYSEHYDMIITDIMMPGIDGFEFAQTVRVQDKNIPILFMTASV